MRKFWLAPSLISGDPTIAGARMASPTSAGHDEFQHAHPCPARQFASAAGLSSGGEP